MTITGVTAGNKVYDGALTAANLNTAGATLSGIIGSDVVTLVSTGATGTFANKNAGTGKDVATSGFTLGGTDTGNYTLIQPHLTANIIFKELTIGGSFLVNNKVYDSFTTATVITNELTLITKAGNDDVTLVTVAVFDDPNIGTGKRVSLTGSSLTGADAPNYYLSLTGAPTTVGTIALFGLTVTGVTANNKIYDGTALTSLNTTGAALVGVKGSDIVSLVSTGAFGEFGE